MADHQVTINSQVYKLIQLGFCACGCGYPTKINSENDKSKGWIKGQPRKYLQGHSLKSLSKGGRRRTSSGYIRILLPNHSRADNMGYVGEHILAAENALSNLLPIGAIVHHANGSRNSGPLVICQDNAYHQLLHRRMKAYAACGHASWRKCWICRQYDEPDKVPHNAHNSCRKTRRKENDGKY